jgi:hypothetical protein
VVPLSEGEQVPEGPGLWGKVRNIGREELKKNTSSVSMSPVLSPVVGIELVVLVHSLDVEK